MKPDKPHKEMNPEMLQSLAILMEHMEEIEVDPVWTEMGRVLGKHVLEQLRVGPLEVRIFPNAPQPYVTVSG